MLLSSEKLCGPVDWSSEPSWQSSAAEGEVQLLAFARLTAPFAWRHTHSIVEHAPECGHGLISD
jgi:hypothetical protein